MSALSTSAQSQSDQNRRRRNPARKPTSGAGRVIATAAMVICGAVTAIPLLLLAANALKTNPQIVSNPIAPPLVPQFGNIADAWAGGTFGDPLSISFLNSVIVTVITTVVVTVLAAMAGYALGAFQFKGERFVTQGVLVLLAIPVQATLIPIFDQLGSWNLRNTYLGIILVYVAFWMPFSILLMRASFRAFPRELLEASRVDGAGELRTLVSVVFPILKGPIAGVAIVNAIGIWSELLFSYVLLTDPALRTLPAAVIAFQGVFTTDYRLLYAGLLISVLPVLIFYGAFSRVIRKGVSAGSFR